MRAEIDAEADQFLGPFVTLTVVGRQRPRDPAETDSLAEGNGFELPVRGCDESGFRSFCVALDCSRLNSIDDLRKGHMTRIALCVIAALVLSLSACTNPYDPVQRGFAGGLWGAASGAAIGAPWERRSEGQPEFLEVSRALLHLHRSPITATQPMDIFLAPGIRVTVIPPIDTHPTRRPATDIQVIPVLPVTPVPRPMDTRETGDTPVIPLRRAMDTKAAKETPLTPVPRPMNTMAMRVTRPTRLAISPKATEHTRPTLVPPAMETRGIWE